MTGTAMPGPPNEPPPPPAPPPPAGWWRWLPTAGMLIITLWLPVPLIFAGSATTPYSYSDFVAKVSAGQVKAVTINDQGAVSGSLNNGTTFTTQIPTALNGSQLESQLRSNPVQITATRAENSLMSVLISFLPLALLIALFIWMG